MPFSVGASGVWKQAQAVSIGVGGVWKSVLNMWIGVGGVWKLMHAALSASASPVTVGGNCNRSTAGSCSASTANTTATPSGGSGSYSYAWEYVSGTNANINFPTSATTNFTRGGAVANPTNNLSGVFRCKVTDTVTGVQVFTNNVTVNTNHTLSV